MGLRHRFLGVFALAFACAALAQQPAGRVEPEVARLPLVIDGASQEVVTHVYKPAGDGPFPVVIFLHGRAGTRLERARMEYPMPPGHGNWWLRRGVAVIAPMRPGYGATGGADVENSGGLWRDAQCYSQPDYAQADANARKTAVAMYEWALRQPWVAKDSILFEGQSVGGMVSIASGALNLPGVRGAVNFSGGHGGNPDVSPGHSCKPELLTELYRTLGRESKLPTLWLYAPNDSYWGPDMPVQWHAAYREGGSDTEFVMTGPVEGHDGHSLFNWGAKMWAAPLDAFARKVGLIAAK